MKNLEKQNRKKKKKLDQKSNRKNKSKIKRKKEREKKKIILPIQPIFLNNFSSKSLEHKSFKLVKLCYMLDATFFVKNVFFG